MLNLVYTVYRLQLFTVSLISLLFAFIYRLVTIVFSLFAVGIGVSVIAETHHDILYAK